MPKILCAIAVVVVAAASGTVTQARTVHNKHVGHRAVSITRDVDRQPTSDIHYFSSSSAGLHVGVNHPPKNR